jgi:hypothetical protein
MPLTPAPNPLLTLGAARLDVMRRYQHACPRCGASVACFKIEHHAGTLVYTVECDAGHRTTV